MNKMPYSIVSFRTRSHYRSMKGHEDRFVLVLKGVMFEFLFKAAFKSCRNDCIWEMSAQEKSQHNHCYQQETLDFLWAPTFWVRFMSFKETWVKNGFSPKCSCLVYFFCMLENVIDSLNSWGDRLVQHNYISHHAL